MHNAVLYNTGTISIHDRVGNIFEYSVIQLYACMYHMDLFRENLSILNSNRSYRNGGKLMFTKLEIQSPSQILFMSTGGNIFS